MERNRPGWWLAAVFACGLFLFFAARFLAYGVESIDDAYISFRYARNLVEGHGLVYNPGEIPVQGYTNFLWTLALAAAIGIGLPPVASAVAMGLVGGLVTTMALTAWSFLRLAPGRAAAAAAPALLVANLGFVIWSIRGLETGLFTALLLGAALLYLRHGPERPFPLASGLLLALATLTRPDGALMAVLIGLHLLAARLVMRQRPATRRDLPAVAVFVTVVAAYALWATWFYGSPLPNTLHAKVGNPLIALPRGWGYLQKFSAYETGWVLWLLPAALLRRRRCDWTRSLAALMVAGTGLYVAGVGGDVFPAYRFLVPVLPFLYLLVGDGIAALEEMGRRGAHGLAGRALARVAVALLLIPLALGTFRPSSAFAWREWRGGNVFTGDMRMVGRWLRENEAPGTRIAVNAAGALPYESRLPTIDMLGLNDREIAATRVRSLGAGRLAGHEKGNGESVFRRRPEIILIENVKLDAQGGALSWKPSGRSERELASRADVRRAYRFEWNPMPDGRVLTFLRLRKDAIPDGPERP